MLCLIGDYVKRHRQLEILCANAVLKVVSSRYAPGTPDRLLQSLADRGAVSAVVEEYSRSGDLEDTCLRYWNSLLEPDALRLEDLVSALLISFATSFAASVLIEGGKYAFPILYRRLKETSVERTLAEMAALESHRREHLQTLLELLNRKADAAASAQATLQEDLSRARAHLLAGKTLAEFVATLPPSLASVGLTPIETIIRGALLTEEQRGTDFRIDHSSEPSAMEGLPLSTFFGVGQIVLSQIVPLNKINGFGRAYDVIEDFVSDIHAPLRDPHKHTYLKDMIGRTPKKVVPVSDSDLSHLIDHPKAFMQCRPLIAGLVLSRGGMTCHTAVLSRGMGIPCIQLTETDFSKLTGYQFMAIQEGKAQLFQFPPDQFHQFL